MRVETASFPKPEEHKPKEAFLERIAKPLGEWVQASESIVEINQRYKGPQGLIKNLAKRVTDNGAAFNLSMGKQTTERHQKRLRRIMENLILESLASNVQSNLSHLQTDLMIKAKNWKIPEEYMSEEMDQEALQLGQDYHREISSWTTIGNSTQDHLQKELTDWLAADFDHLLELERLAQLSPDPAENLLQFLSANSSPLEAGPILARQKELANPKDQRLINFFDQMAQAYYRQGQYAQTWPLVELSIPLASDNIRSFYTGISDVAKRQQVLIAPLVENWHQFQKTLPPPVRDQYAVYLTHLQEETAARIKEAASKFKIKQPKLIPIGVPFLPEEFTVDQKEPTAAEQSIATAEAAKPHKVILIDGQVCADETSLRTAIEGLFSTKLKSVRQNYIDSYTLILAKEAGIRSNAPKYEMKKISGFPQISLSDGSREPVLRLRLTSSDAPRICLAFHQDYLIVIDAFNRDDHSYTQLMRQGGFSGIQLPSCPSQS